MPVPGPQNLYEFDFSHGLGRWMSWMSPSLIRDDPGAESDFVRLQAPGRLDPNHLDGIGALRLVAHLSLSDGAYARGERLCRDLSSHRRFRA